MRGLLLFVVVGAVLWLVVTQFRGEEGAGGEQVTGFVVLPETGDGGSPDEPDPALALPPVEEPATPAEEDVATRTGAGAAPNGSPSTATAPAHARVPIETAARDRPALELGGPTADLDELGRVLVASYVTGDPAVLEAHVNGPAGEGLAPGARLLIQAFWESVVRGGAPPEERLQELRASEAVTPDQLQALESSFAGDAARPVSASAGRDPLALAMRLVLAHRAALEAERHGDAGAAAQGYSSVLLLALRAPWPADRSALTEWRDALNRAQDGARLDPRGDWPSIEVDVRSGDTLIGIRSRLVAERPQLLLCTGLVERVNALGKYIQPGQVLRIPTARPSVLVDVDARTLLYLHDDEVVRAWEVGVGKEGHETPVGSYSVGEKQVDPSWMPLGGPQLPFGHPDNPLGTRWIAWFDANGQKTSYGIHGTSDPDGVGGPVSQGCVRMHNPAVEELYELLPIGARVVVQP